MNYAAIKKLKSGTDVRGVASPVLGRAVTLTKDAVEVIARAFVTWLTEKTGKKSVKIALGYDSRITAEILKNAFVRGATCCGADVCCTGLSSTPSMFMILQDKNRALDGSVMITASHLPADRNGLKFFTPEGGLEGSDAHTVKAFSDELTRLGTSNTVRRTLGSDIDGACGQLRRRYLSDGGSCRD